MRRIANLAAAIFAMAGASVSAFAQDIPEAPVIANPPAPAGGSELLDTKLIPFEFWLTVVILVFGLVLSILTIRFLSSTVARKTEEAIRALVVLWVIIGTLTLITAGYSDQQIAPAFGLFGTIVGYILGKSDRGEGRRPPAGAGTEGR
jgi:branched-subunit amino acid ABC-type transport system permease component